MSQPSVANYFSTRKRTLNEDHKINRARKVLVLDCDDGVSKKEIEDRQIIVTKDNSNKIVANPSKNEASKKIIKSAKVKKVKEVPNQQDIQQLLTNLNAKERCVTPPVKEQVQGTSKELNDIKKKLSRSARLGELKASIGRFKEASNKLKEAEKRTAAISESPKLKTFRTIELEVEVSPQKAQSPEKPYLSPRKNASPGVRRNLLNLLSPTKNAVAAQSESPSKKILETVGTKLTLPFKYRHLAEIFRAIDTISQMLYNRKEVITFSKLKTAVEEMLKRTLTLKHVAQIKTIFPEAFNCQQEKLRVFGAGMRQENWELVLVPCVEGERMTSDILLDRRRKLFNILLEKVKDYHNEFLLSLEPPMVIEKSKVTRWHPEFDLEKVPDLELADLPQPPTEEKLTTGRQVLEKARQLFQCNTRMEQALEKLKNKTIQDSKSNDLPQISNSLLKGIPKALLEKVRERQAAKALVSMTRSVDKDKEVQLYSRLPELARLTRNLFVSEKKGVLPLDIVVDKLGNSYRCFLTKADMEEHLKVLAKECPDWLIFYNIRNTVYLKLMKNADLSIVLNKLENLAKNKNES